MNDRQRKAMFANMFSQEPGRPNIKFRPGYEQAVSDEEIMDIINKDVDFASLPAGTVEYFPIKDFGRANAKKFSEDVAGMLTSGNMKSKSLPVYNEGVLVGYSTVASERGKRVEYAPKLADSGFYEEVYFAGQDDDIDAVEEKRLALVDAWSKAEGDNADAYYMYTRDGGKMSYRDFLDKYDFMKSKNISGPESLKKVIEYYG